jgi:hypothetical protein
MSASIARTSDIVVVASRLRDENSIHEASRKSVYQTWVSEDTVTVRLPSMGAASVTVSWRVPGSAST